MFCGDAEAGQGAAEPLALADALAVLLPGAPRGAHRLWRLHAEIGGGASPLLPTGWEQRCDRATGRVFYIDHNLRTTSWVDPRVKPAAARAASPAAAPPLLTFDLSNWDREAAPGGEEGGDEAAAEGKAEAPAARRDSPAGPSSHGSPSPHGVSAEVPVPVGTGDGLLGGNDSLFGGNDSPFGGSDGLSGGSDGVLGAAPAGSADPPADAGDEPRETAFSATPPVELQALSAGVLPQTADRLARRAHLQLSAAAAAATAPSAHGRRGYELLLHRRCRLIQRLHLALRQQGKLGQVAVAQWEAILIDQRRAAAAGRPAHSVKVAERAVEAMHRHASARLTDAYTTQWLLKTRTHLARCSAALASLYPLQLLDATPAQVAVLGTLQTSLLALVKERVQAQPRGAGVGGRGGDDETLSEALRALLRLGVSRGEMCDLLIACEALLSAGQGTVVEAMEAVADLEVGTSRELSAGLAATPSVSLGAVWKHPLIGSSPAEDPARAGLLSAGYLEACAAAVLVLAMLAEAAVATVRGVGPWEHRLSSLISEPPPSEIARAVALAAAGGGTPTPTLHRPVCLDVSPSGMRLLI
eukprot:scaffold22891_cov82-Isochrysis_galbana.AAC.2